MTHRTRYALWGFGFGLLFPIFAIAFSVQDSDLSISIGGLRAAHQAAPLLWMVDTAPLWLSLFAAIAGSKQDLLEGLIANLESTVAQRTHSLEAARDEAIAGSLAKDRFLGAMSHELRTPLNAIIGFAGVLSKGEKFESKQRDYVEGIGRNGRRLLTLVDNALGLAAHGPIDTNMEAVGLNEIAAEIAASSEAAGNPITLKLPPIPVTAACRAQDLTRVLANLVDNAHKFAPEGEVCLRLVNLPDDAWPMAFEVEDHGPGIAPDQRSALFEPFSQGDSGAARSHDGAGLGLATAKKLCERMGLRIELDGQLGKGSIFRVRIPREALGRKLGQFNLDSGTILTGSQDTADGPRRPS